MSAPVASVLTVVAPMKVSPSTPALRDRARRAEELDQVGRNWPADVSHVDLGRVERRVGEGRGDGRRGDAVVGRAVQLRCRGCRSRRSNWTRSYRRCPRSTWTPSSVLKAIVFPWAEASAADRIARRIRDLDPVDLVAQRQLAGDVGADEVADDRVLADGPLGRAAVDLDAPVIGRDQVPGRRGGAADRVVPGALRRSGCLAGRWAARSSRSCRCR